MPSKDLEVEAANGELLVQRSGLYRILSVRDKYCPGLVKEDESDYVVEFIPRPSLTIADSAGSLAKNGSFIHPPVCERTEDSFGLVFTGRPPFVAVYEHEKEGSGQGHREPRMLQAVQSQTSVRLSTESAGHHVYDFKTVGDAIYTTPSTQGVISRSAGTVLRLEQDVYQLPYTLFRYKAQSPFCVQERLVSRGSHDLVLDLSGQPPFELDLEVYEDPSHSRQRFTIPSVKEREWAIDVPFVFHSAGPHTISVRKIVDGNGCSRTYERGSLTGSTTVQVAEIASIAAVQAQESHCVGDTIDYVLQGSAPWTVTYEFNKKRKTVTVKEPSFSRVAEKPGDFSIVKVAHQQGQCESKVVDMKKRIWDLPRAVVRQGSHYIEDIREGDQAEIVFHFTGEPPVSTYSPCPT